MVKKKISSLSLGYSYLRLRRPWTGSGCLGGGSSCGERGAAP